MIDIAPFEDEVQELRTLPRARCFIDGLWFNVYIYPDQIVRNGVTIPAKEVAVIVADQTPTAQAYLSGVLDMQEKYANDIIFQSGGIPMAGLMDRRFIFKTVPEDFIVYG